MGFDEAVAELERSKALGAKGVKLHSDFQRFYIDDEKAIEKYELMRAECGRRELEFERWYDHAAAFSHFDRWFRAETKKGAEFRDFDE